MRCARGTEPAAPAAPEETRKGMIAAPAEDPPGGGMRAKMGRWPLAELGRVRLEGAAAIARDGHLQTMWKDGLPA